MAAIDVEATRWLVLYGAQLHPARQRKVLLGVNPRSSSAVLIPTAWLSWDLAGVPYIEPCFCSAIVQGYNDHEGRSEAVAKGEKEEGEGYRKWVWDRCAPGKEYRGRMPPHLEGIAYELNPTDFELVAARTREMLPTVPTECVAVRATKFAEGDSSRPLGEISEAQLLVARTAHDAQLQPTRDYFMLVLRGAFFNTLSQPYLAHLTMLQPFDPSTSRLKSLARYFLTLSLVPSFVLFFLPAQILRWPAWARFGTWLTGTQGVTGARWLERLVLSRFAGSGWRNDGKSLGGTGI